MKRSAEHHTNHNTPALWRLRRLPALSLAIALALPVLGYSQIRTITFPAATLRLAESSCDLVGLDWRQPALQIIAEPRLGENFRVLLPKPGYQAAYFNSRDQKVSRVDVQPESVTCVYQGLRNESEHVPVDVRYQIRSVGSQIQFSIEVDNPTDRKLAEVLYGIVGGQQGIEKRADTESLLPASWGRPMPKMFSHYEGGAYGGGNLGIRYDASAFTYPGALSMGWIDVYNRKADVGYYYGNQDAETRVTAYYTELHPFTKSAVLNDNWPTALEANHEPVGITMGWVNFPYIAQGTFTGGPAAIEVHRGDWHSGSHIYRQWFDRNFHVARAPDWLRQEMAWQSIILANPEDVVRWRFPDLPKLAHAAKKYNITTFEILGWDIGGIDRGYPQYQPDPRLGTAEEFREALAEMKAEGVHPLIFSNIQYADTATALFRKWLSQYAVQGEWAPDLHLDGWGEGTISARLGLTRSNMTWISPSFPAVRHHLVNQYLDLLRDGADGFQFDKAILMGVLDFNPKLPVSPDKSLPDGVLNTYRELLEKGRKINPDMAIASENWFDRALPYVDVSYTRYGDIDMPSTAERYTFPEWTSTIFGESPGDFGPMNNGMRYGLVWALAPRHYNDSVDEELTRPLSRYVQELIRIRKKYRDLLFLGRFNDTLGAQVKSDADVRYSIFTPANPDVHRRAVVLVNFGAESETAEIKLDGFENAPLTVAAPFEPERKVEQPARLTIPPQRCVVLITQ